MKNSLVIACLVMSSVAAASPVGGIARSGGTLDPGDIDDYGIVLKGTEPWVVFAWGEGESKGADLDCAVFDNDGTLIDKDDGPHNTCYVKGTPDKTAHFTVRVMNAGDEAVTYKVRVK